MGNAYTLWAAYKFPKEKDMPGKLKQNILAGNGETYTLCVAIIRQRSEDGRPRVVELIPDDNEQINVKNPENRDMLLVYCDRRSVRKKHGPGGMRDQP